MLAGGAVSTQESAFALLLEGWRQGMRQREPSDDGSASAYIGFVGFVPGRHRNGLSEGKGAEGMFLTACEGGFAEGAARDPSSCHKAAQGSVWVRIELFNHEDTYCKYDDVCLNQQEMSFKFKGTSCNQL